MHQNQEIAQPKRVKYVTKLRLWQREKHFKRKE